MKKDNENGSKPQRAMLLLLSGLLATLFILVSVQWMAAQDSQPPQPDPDKGSLERDRMLTDAELEQVEPRIQRYMAMELIPNELLLASDLSSSSKDVNLDEVPAGNQIQYTIVISNSGDMEVPVLMTDMLPAEIVYESHDFNDPPFNGWRTGGGVVGNEVTWEGTLGSKGYAEILIVASVKEDVAADTIISNIAEISGGGQTFSPSATVKVLAPLESQDVVLPFITYGFTPDPPDVTNVSATRPNSKNEFTLSWTGGPNATWYEVQSSNYPDFRSPVERDVGLATSLLYNPDPSFRNEFYFRVRSYDGGVAGNWSDVVEVVGAYLDEFNDEASNWIIRRTTHIDRVKTWYEIDPPYGRLVLEIRDKWDWGISSPLVRAPKPPYVIEYDGKFAQTPNEVAMGIVFGGDRPDEDCPDTSSAEGMYRHERCFNHFYNPQYYWAGEALHFLWYRTDRLEWCPSCGGSPMKRLGDSENVGQMDGVSNDGWNRHRIEVREGSIKYFAGRPHDAQLRLQYEYHDTRWIHEPYFGVFAYAGEYTASVAVFDYFSITPLDS